MRKLGIALLALALAAAFWFIPHEGEFEERPPDEVEEPLQAIDAPHVLALDAVQRPDAQPGRTVWALSYPRRDPRGVRLLVDLPTPPASPESGDAPVTGAPLAGAITLAEPPPAETASAFLRELATVLWATPPIPAGEATSRLEIGAMLLGTRLARDASVVGGEVVAGEFASAPDGAWTVWRVSLGPGGGQCFLAVNVREESALVLMRDAGDGNAIVSAFARLVGVPPPATVGDRTP